MGFIWKAHNTLTKMNLKDSVLNGAYSWNVTNKGKIWYIERDILKAAKLHCVLLHFSVPKIFYLLIELHKKIITINFNHIIGQ